MGEDFNTPRPVHAFQNTLWSKVLKAAALDSTVSRLAWEHLSRAYWEPTYEFLRRAGNDRESARDLTQGFFLYIIEEKIISKADPKRGRFRSFLIGVLKNFAANENARQTALKRGGGASIISIDEESAEGNYRHEPSTTLSPEKLFDKRWALLVLSQAMERLREEYNRVGFGDSFQILQPYLTGDDNASFAELGKLLNKTEGAARLDVHRLRNRFRQSIRAVIADTVRTMAEVESELEDLQAALRG